MTDTAQETREAKRAKREDTETETKVKDTYEALRGDIPGFLADVSDFFAERRRPVYLTEEVHERLTAAFTAVVDELLDEDDEIDDDEVDTDDILAKVKVLRAFYGG